MHARWCKGDGQGQGWARVIAGILEGWQGQQRLEVAVEASLMAGVAEARGRGRGILRGMVGASLVAGVAEAQGRGGGILRGMVGVSLRDSRGSRGLRWGQGQPWGMVQMSTIL